MAKISMRHSVAEGYWLLFGRPLTVIGLTWLPAVFYAVGADYLIRRMDNAMAIAVPSTSGLLGQYAFFYFVALLVATAFFGALIAVPLTRQALGLREEPVAAHLVVGSREIRLFLALLRYYAILVCAIVVLAVGAGIAITQGSHYALAHGAPAQWLGVSLETWFNSAAAAISAIVFALLAVRFGFFLDAIAAVEDRAKLSRASALAQGNFWPIVGTLLAVAVPAALVWLPSEMTFGGLSAAGVAPENIAQFAIVLTVGLVVVHTLAAGASAGAYSELAEEAVQERAPMTIAPSLAPAATFARSSDVETIPPAPVPPSAPIVERSVHVVVPTVMQAAAAAMVIATPEATSPGAVDWMAPPPEAHFGTDPHDAVAGPKSDPLSGAYDHDAANVEAGAEEPHGQTKRVRIAFDPPLAREPKPDDAGADAKADAASGEANTDAARAEASFVVSANAEASEPEAAKSETVANEAAKNEATASAAAVAPPAANDHGDASPNLTVNGHREASANSNVNGHSDADEDSSEADNGELPMPPLDPVGAMSTQPDVHMPV